MKYVPNPLGNPNIAEYGAKTRFKPGNPGGGRPVGSGPAALKQKLEEYLSLDTSVILPDGTKDKRAVLDSIVLAMLSKASRGDINAAKEVLDRFYGKQADKVELTGKDGEALKINHSAHLESLYSGMKDAFDSTAIEKK